MDRVIEELRTFAAETADLEKAGYLLVWDEETHMPAGGGEERTHQHAAVERAVQDRWASDELARLLERAAPLVDRLDPESDEATLIRVLRRDSDKARRVPEGIRLEIAACQARSFGLWQKARAERDFGVLVGEFERVVDLRRAYAEAFGALTDPYDALLDDYEPDMTAAEVDAVFAQVKPALGEVLANLRDAADDGTDVLRGQFDPDRQRRFTLWLLGHWGFDEDSWRLDRSVHPSQLSLAASDVRVTGRFDGDGLRGIFGVLHEFGHGLYRRQVAGSLSRSPLREPPSSALDESQSRLWENVVGRRMSTWRYAYPRLREEFPEQLRSVPLERFYRAMNSVRPTAVRTVADEVTYGLHIILRYQLERELLAGTVAPRDLPDAFAAAMRDTLGVEPRDITEGVLQDPHWFDLGFGYFPTITLGDVVALQIWERAEAELGDLDERFERGEFHDLVEWLAREVHRHGRKFSAPETLRRAAGGPLDAGPYVTYLRNKYGVDES
ncbi:carboxypeptidase M32 [Streptomyces sp. NPDC017940]|uniref:carboxypeptidase M32 n=1 Tax=Streptomyces sp. NPDC017940 TaxID=3365017 RepID=UPI00379C6724